MQEEKSYKEESLIKQVLTSEVKFVIGVITVALGVIGPYYAIKQDIALIKDNISNINSNHEVHIQDLTQQMKEQNSILLAQGSQIIELQKQMIAITSRQK